MDSEVKEEVPVHEEFILCCGVETQVLKCGPWTDLLKAPSASRPKLLIFVITGNPGFATVYVPFVKALYSAINRRFPVWVISHAGQVVAPKDKKILETPDDPNAQEIKDIYGLSGQVEHKMAFLRTHVPKETKLVLIGHSIGSYICLQILKQAPEMPNVITESEAGFSIIVRPTAGLKQALKNAGRSTSHQTVQFTVIIRACLLFPTIERMSETPNGRIATPLLCWLRYAVYASSYLLLKPCPEKVKSWLIRMALQRMNLQSEHSLLNVLEPFCLANAAYLGGQEMMQVVKRDNETIKEHLPKLTFYYGTIDRWCPTEYYEDIKKDFPEGDIRLCEKKISHAFVLYYHQEMADMVADWLKDDLAKIEAAESGNRD